MNSTLRDNEKFINLYDWLLHSMNDEMFQEIEQFLINDQRRNNKGKNFLEDKSKYFKNEVCSMVALQQRKFPVPKTVREVYKINMYKFRGYRQTWNFIKKDISLSLIQKEVEELNITQSEISKACDDPDNMNMKTNMGRVIKKFKD